MIISKKNLKSDLIQLINKIFFKKIDRLFGIYFIRNTFLNLNPFI